MESRHQKLAKLVVLMISAWVVGAALYGFLTVSAKLALPPSAELYTRTTSFQVMQFVFFKLSPLVFLLGGSLAIFFSLAQFHARTRSTFLTSVMAVLYVVLVAIYAVFFIVTSTMQWNPYFNPTEQRILTFLLTPFSLLTLSFVVVLLLPFRWGQHEAS